MIMVQCKKFCKTVYKIRARKETQKVLKASRLILLDGGQGQSSAVMPVLKEFGIEVPVFGMVKDSKHKTRAIANGGSEISIKASRQAFTIFKYSRGSP